MKAYVNWNAGVCRVIDDITQQVVASSADFGRATRKARKLGYDVTVYAARAPRGASSVTGGSYVLRAMLCCLIAAICSACGGGREPTRELKQEDRRSEHVCSPENPAPGSRIGCVGDDGSCLTYECCEEYGCGPDGEPCDCCGFDDAPLEEC